MSEAAESPIGVPDQDGFSVQTADGAGGYPTVAVAGDVDLLTAPQVEAAVSEAQQQSSAVLLDLSAVNFLGSAGLSVLVAAARRAGETDAAFAVLVTERAVLRAIDVTGLSSTLAVFDTAEAASAFLRR